MVQIVVGQVQAFEVTHLIESFAQSNAHLVANFIAFKIDFLQLRRPSPHHKAKFYVELAFQSWIEREIDICDHLRLYLPQHL